MLHVHRADRADALVRALGALLADAPADPFAREVVGVPTRGVERWLTQTLSNTLGAQPGRGDGIVAHVDFPSPRKIVDGVVAAACEVDPDDDPWSPERTLWPLLELVDEELGSAWLKVLADHLRDSAPPDAEHPRRLAAVRHLAILFDRYALHRPDMVLAWHAGRDDDGSGAALTDTNLVWQAELWRRLRARIGSPSPAERLGDAEERVRAGASLDLPARLGVFGLTRLPAAHLRVLRALATHRDVHLFVLHPSPALWDRVAPHVPVESLRRGDDPTAGLPRNRLLASWGRDVRELQLVLGEGNADHLEDAGTAPRATLLGRIQQDVRDDAEPPAERALLDRADDSLQVHACHGRARQVEVLRDAILHALAEDPTLEPRDIVVMCPDIEAFAPLVHATFGAGVQAEDPAEDGTLDGLPDLRVRLADRALRQTNPVLGTISRLLELADSRMTASEVLDLADRPPVRRRFGLDDDALATLESWVSETEIRWGLDAAHRAPFKLAAISANTWEAGLDRVLTGATMTSQSLTLVGDAALPLDEVDSGDIDLAGRFAELIARLTHVTTRFTTAMPIGEWAAAIAQAADLLTATSPRDTWQRLQLDGLLAALTEEAADARDGAPLELAEVRALLAEQLRGRPTRANFRTGHLTFCTLNPMRSVPHRVICLLGLDDAAFPRKAPRDGDDLIFDDPHLGDHDARGEDRQLLLDALLAAKDRLVITYTGNDERTNAPMPPAVPVGELLDMVDRTAVAPDGAPAREAIVTRHPLQPFDERVFTPGRLRPRTPFGFDPVALEGARALAAPRRERPPFLPGPLPPDPSPVIELDDLVAFVQHPARAFLRRRLDVRLGDFTEELEEGLPIALDPLEQWAVGDRILRALLDGHTVEDARAAERARGCLPPGRLAEEVLEEIVGKVRPIADLARAELTATSDLQSLDVHVALADGRVLSGTVAGLSGDCLQTVQYSRVGPKHRLAAWVRLLALTAARPERTFRAVTIGRARSGSRHGTWVTMARLAPVADAAQQLATLVDLYDRGMREPAPLACDTSAAYADAVRRDRNAEAAAGKAWTSEWKRSREDRDPEHRLLHGGEVPFGELLAEPPRSDETGPGWDDTQQASRFGRWAVRLWAPVLAREELKDS